MTMVTVKTAELEGAALDWAVDKATGTQWARPSTEWTQGGPLIESRHVTVDFNMSAEEDPSYDQEPWISCIGQHSGCYYGATPLIAAMRAIVAADLGDTVEIPEELVK